MVSGPELGLLALVVVIVAAVYLSLKVVKPLIVNAIVGLIVLFLADFVGFGVVITPVVILIVAFGGLPGAAIVIILAYLGLVFEPAMLVPPLL